MKQFLLLSAVLLGLAVSASAQPARSGLPRRGEASSARAASRYVARPSRSCSSARRGVAVRVAEPTRSAITRGRFEPRREARRRGPLRFGRWELRCERVLVPGCWEARAVPAVHGWALDLCGVRVWTVITPPRIERVWVPAHYETRQRRVWVRY